MLNSLIKYVKDNLAIIALIPLTLGGAWQILSLALISPSYIRFFSVSQQISDGILILFICLIFYIVFFLGRIPFGKNIKTAVWLELSKKQLMYKLVFALLWILSFSMLIYFMFFLLSTQEDKESLSYITSLIFFGTVMLFAVIRIFYIFNAFLIINGIDIGKVKIPKNDWFTFFFASLGTAVIMGSGLMFIVLILNLFASFHKYFSIPKNLKNVEYVIDEYKKNNLSTSLDSVKVLYMNDKYIFFNDSGKVAVVKFDYMFKGSK